MESWTNTPPEWKQGKPCGLRDKQCIPNPCQKCP